MQQEIIMTKQLSSHAAAAKMIRTHIKSLGIKATVKASSYAYGSSIRAEVHNVCPAVRKELKSYVDQFQYGQFDVMTDCYHTTNNRQDIPQVKFTFLNVTYSNEIKQKAYEWVREHCSGYKTSSEKFEEVTCWDKSESGQFITETVYHVLNGNLSNLAEQFWSTIQG